MTQLTKTKKLRGKWVTVLLAAVMLIAAIAANPVYSKNIVTRSTTPSAASQATQNLLNLTESMNLDHGLTKSLEAKLRAAIDSLNSGDSESAANQLNAFMNEVKAKCCDSPPGKPLTGSQVSVLISDATQIIQSLTATLTATMTSVSQTTISQQSSSTGLITVTGILHIVVENPQCYPQCLMPSILLTYLTVPLNILCPVSTKCTPTNYRLLQTNGVSLSSALNDTQVTVTGILIQPSSWSCNSFYVPSVCMSGDIYVNKITP